MNLKDIRTAVFSQADWAPTQANDAIVRVNAFINRAYFQLALEAPFLFFEDSVRFVAKEDYDATAATDLIGVVATDPWVMQRGINVAVVAATTGATLWGDATAGGGFDPQFWNGRMVEITDAAGITHRRRVREFFNRTVDEAKFEAFSLYRPWNNVTQTGMDYRFYDEANYLPDDVIEVNSLRLYRGGQNWPLAIAGQMEAEQLSIADLPSQVASGVPRTAYRRGHFQIDAPTIGPDAAAIEKYGNWAGPEWAGSFKYLITYCWGRRDVDMRSFGPYSSITGNNTEGSLLEPKWESAPSPVSPEATTTNNGFSIYLSIPTPDWAMGFGHSNDVRYTHSGFYTRIYRQRTSSDTTNPITSDQSVVGGSVRSPNTDEFFLIAEVDGSVNNWVDAGLIVPDYHRRLREVHGYQAVALYPRPDARYEIDVRCVRRPQKLADDADAPRIHLDGVSCLVQKTLGYLYEAQGNPEMADRAQVRYDRDLIYLTRRYGDLRYPEEPIMKRPARARQVSNSRRPWRRWYNLP